MGRDHRCQLMGPRNGGSTAGASTRNSAGVAPLPPTWSVPLPEQRPALHAIGPSTVVEDVLPITEPVAASYAVKANPGLAVRLLG